MNIIWNESELKRIQLILRKYNIKINENNELVAHNYTGYFNECTLKEKNELKQLFYYQNRNEVLNILAKVNETKILFESSKDNPLYFGLISSIANINSNDCAEIFNIFKEIIFQYTRVTDDLAKRIIETLKEPSLISEKIEEIKNSDKETKEELYIKNYINKIFENISYIRNSEIFESLIDGLDNNIKQNLIGSLSKKNKAIILQRKKLDDSVVTDYFGSVAKKVAKKRKISFGDRY